jgi:hypothetical protein
MELRSTVISPQQRMTELLPQVIGLLPQFRVEPEEVDQLGGGNSQARGDFRDTPLASQEHIEDDAGRRPELRLLHRAGQVLGGQSAALPIRMGQQGGLQWLRHLFPHLQIQGYPQPFQGSGLVFVLGTTFFSNDDQATRSVPQPDGGAGLVPLLAARSASSVGIHLALGQQLLIAQLGPDRSPRQIHRRQFLGPIQQSCPRCVNGGLLLSGDIRPGDVTRLTFSRSGH